MESEIEPNVLPIQSTRRHDTASTIIGKTKTFAGLEIIEWAFLTVSFVNILTCVGITMYRLVIVIQHEPGSADFTFAVLILINTVFCMMYVIHGVLHEKEFEIYAFMAASLCILAYCALEYAIHRQGRTAVKLARLIVVSCLVPVNTALGIFVAKRFGWLEFKIVGASEAMQAMYKEASRFTSLLKFDLQVALSFLVLVLQDGTNATSSDIVQVSVGAAFSVFWCIVGWLSMRKEWKLGAALFGLLGILGPAFVIYKIGFKWHSLLASNAHHVTLIYATLAAGAAYLAVRAVLYFELFRVCRNFNQGLRERAFEVDERTSLLSLSSKR